jgi:hypothetical protein
VLIVYKHGNSGGSLAWAIMARSLFSRLGTACLLYLYVINVIYLVPNKAVKKNFKKGIYICIAGLNRRAGYKATENRITNHTTLTGMMKRFSRN